MPFAGAGLARGAVTGVPAGRLGAGGPSTIARAPVSGWVAKIAEVGARLRRSPRALSMGEGAPAPATPIGNGFEREWHDIRWWQGRLGQQVQETLPPGGTVRTVIPAPPHIVQNNTTLSRVTLDVEGVPARRFVVKEVDLRHVAFRDEEHRERTWQSYLCEVGFYYFFAERLPAGITPRMFTVEQPGDDQLLLVLEDLTDAGEADFAGGSVLGATWKPFMNKESGDGDESGDMGQKGSLKYEEAKEALRTLARVHGTLLTVTMEETEVAGLWSEGSYWSLSKREGDIGDLESNWAATIESFASVHPVARSEGVRGLGTSLRSWASEANYVLQRSTWKSVLHGDYKAANLFLRGSKVAVVDWQWAGLGCPAVDLVYLIWSSVDPDVVRDHESELVMTYLASLLPEVAKKGQRIPTTEEFRGLYNAALVDYVRFLAGSMWKGVTPVGCATRHGARNLGMHRRHAPHLLRLACRCADIIAAGTGGEDGPHMDWSRAPVPGMRGVGPEGPPGPLTESLDASWDSLFRGPVMEFAAAGAHLAEDAGRVIRQYPTQADEGALAVRDKGDGVATEADGALVGSSDGDGAAAVPMDPQTAADVEAERLVVGSLVKAFPGIQVMGEEMFETGADSRGESGGGGAGGGAQEGPSLESIFGSEAAQAVFRAVSVPGFFAALPSVVRQADWRELTAWVDPLDGTRELLLGNAPGVTVLVGLALRGQPVCGIVHQPFARGGPRTVVGIPGAGAFVRQYADGEGEPRPEFVRIDAKTFPWREFMEKGRNRDGEMVVATTRSHSSPEVQEAALRVQPDAQRVLAVGGAGNKAMMLMDGEVSHYVFASGGTKRWDTAAPEAVIRSLGGFLVDALGDPYDYSLPPFKRVEDIPKDRVHNTRGVVAGMSEGAFAVARAAFWETWMEKSMPL